jgi:hypothetical protein
VSSNLKSLAVSMRIVGVFRFAWPLIYPKKTHDYNYDFFAISFVTIYKPHLGFSEV